MRPFRARALVATLVLLAAGCQDYNFNPVGHCLIQPGAQSFTLSDISTADVLFVVDDSGSMGGEQQRLADAFGVFVSNLTTTNVARAAAGRPPFDFHIAVTTTSVFWNFSPRTPDVTPTQICQSSCPGAAGQLVCCNGGTTPTKQPRRCTDASQCAGVAGGTTCSQHCTGLQGEGYCCAGANTTAPLVDVVPCARAGVECGKLETHYNFAGGCATGTSDRGVAENGWPYPDGDFVGIASDTTTSANPRVIHYDKRLYTSSDGPLGVGRNAQGFTRTQLDGFFTANIKVGTCGSGEEQGLQAGRLALQQAFAGGQTDPYHYDWAQSLTSTSPPDTTHPPLWNPAERTAGYAASWPNPRSKIVLVFVGDEDDCSSPRDPSGGVVMLAELAGADACVHDADPSNPVGNKQFQVSQFVDYFTSLNRPLGAAFIVSARSTTGSETSCSGSTCVADICCDRQCVWNEASSTQCSGTVASCVCSYDVCGGQAPGTRFIEAAHQLEAKGVGTVIGSVCDDFGPLLNQIAEIVKPPETLTLPSVPAEGRIAMLRIVEPNGDTRKICNPPLPPQQPNYTLAAAQNTGADWWFVETSDPGPPWDPSGAATVAVPTKYVYINSVKGSCLLNPGETWSLDYLGVVPTGGCVQMAGDSAAGGSLDCQAKLGGQVTAWSCYTPPGLTTGTCTCSGT